MTEHQNTPQTPTPRHRALTAPAAQPSLIKWHCGALIFLVSAIFIALSLDGSSIKDYSSSKEPLEYVFAPLWGLFNWAAYLAAFAVFGLAGAYGLSLMARHRHWHLPESNRPAAMVLLSLVSLPMLLLAAFVAVASLNEWVASFQAPATRHTALLTLCAGLLGGWPWLYGQYRAWRQFLSRSAA